MNEETYLKSLAMVLATIIVLCAFIMGHDGQLAFIAVILLFGGEKLLRKISLKN